MNEAELIALPNRYKILSKISSPGSCIRMHCICKFDILNPVFSVRKCGEDFVSIPNSISAGVVSMKMGVDHYVNLIRGDTMLTKIIN